MQLRSYPESSLVLTAAAASAAAAIFGSPLLNFVLGTSQVQGRSEINLVYMYSSTKQYYIRQIECFKGPASQHSRQTSETSLKEIETEPTARSSGREIMSESECPFCLLDVIDWV